MTYFTTGVQLQDAIDALPDSKKGGFLPFDGAYYLAHYMVGYTGTLSALEHFVQIGADLDNAPSAQFDPVYYAGAYADLTGAGFNSADLLYHFLKYGLDEGRAPNAALAAFNSDAYLANNPDVAAYVNANLADFNGSASNGALAHFVKFGQYEGRSDVPATTTFTLTASAAEINEGVANTFTVTASEAVAVDTEVTFQLVLGTAQLEDFGAGSFNPAKVTIKAGEKTASYAYTAKGNDGTELSETYSVNATVGGVAVGTANVTILDGGIGAGETFMLTTGIDSGAEFTGTSGNDTFVADDTTYTTGDDLNGGAGNDTLTLVAAADEASVVDLTSIENVSVRAVTTATTGLDASGWTGVETLVNDRSSQDLKVVGLTSAVDLELNKVTDGKTFEVTFANSLFGATGTLNVASTSTGTTAGTGTEVKVDVGAADDITTLAVDVTGDNILKYTYVGGKAGTDEVLTTLNVTGTGSLELVEAAEELKLVTTVTATNAGGLTVDFDTNAKNMTINTGAGDDDITADGGGKITANLGAGDDTITTGAAADTIDGGDGDDTIDAGTGDDSVTGGAGNDTITVGAGAVTVNAGAGDDVVDVAGTLDATDSVDGGDGTADVLADTAAGFTATAADADILATISNFERIRITDDVSTIALDVSDFGVNYVQFDGSVSTSADLSGFTSGATVEFRGRESIAQVVVGMTNATAAKTPNDTLNVLLNADLTSNDVTYSVGLDVEGINIINVTARDSDTTSDPDTATDGGEGYTLDLDAGNGALDANITQINIDSTVEFNYTSSGTDSAIVTIDGSDSTGSLVVSMNGFGGTQAVEIIGGSGDDTLTGSGLADDITGGDGDDIIDGNDGNNVVINAGAGDDTVSTGTGTGVTVTLGTGSDIINFESRQVDTLTGATVVADFTGGADGDVIDLSAAGNTANGGLLADTDGTLKVLASSSTGAVAWADNQVLAVSTSAIANLDTKAEIAALFGAGKVFEAATQDDEATLLIADTTTNKVYVYSLVESNVNTSFADALDTVSLVGVLNNVTSTQLDAFVAANFQA